MENVSLFGHLRFSLTMAKLKRVERLKRVLLKTSVPTIEGARPKINLPKKTKSKLKEIHSSMGMVKGWYCICKGISF